MNLGYLILIGLVCIQGLCVLAGWIWSLRSRGKLKRYHTRFIEEVSELKPEPMSLREVCSLIRVEDVLRDFIDGFKDPYKKED